MPPPAKLLEQPMNSERNSGMRILSMEDKVQAVQEWLKGGRCASLDI